MGRHPTTPSPGPKDSSDRNPRRITENHFYDWNEAMTQILHPPAAGDTTPPDMSETHTEAPSCYPPPAEFAENANATAELYREAEQDRLAFWAKQANRLSWETPFDRGAGLVGGAVREVVRRRQTQRRLQLRGPTRRGRQRRPGGHPLGGRAGRREPQPDLLRPAGRGVARPPTRSPTSVWSQVTGSPSTCRWSPRRSWRCWRARGSVPCIPWCSPATRPRRCEPGSTTRRPSWSSPPTGSTAAARRFR